MTATRVTYRAGFTRNMDNYESLRLDIGVEGDPLGDETTSQAYNRIKDFVESKLLTDIDALEHEIVRTRAAARGK